MSPEPLSADRLAEIREREQAATPGPWCTDEWEIHQGTEYIPGISQWIGETCRTDAEDGGRADAAFIADAREAVPALLAEVARLSARVAELERPEIKRKRSEIQLSYWQLAAQAREDGDSEGEATVLQRLEAREDEWAAEDAKAGELR